MKQQMRFYVETFLLKVGKTMIRPHRISATPLKLKHQKLLHTQAILRT